jgi:hypothetical protein
MPCSKNVRGFGDLPGVLCRSQAREPLTIAEQRSVPAPPADRAAVLGCPDRIRTPEHHRSGSRQPRQ